MHRRVLGLGPLLITLGDKTHITGQCQFTKQDGSTLFLRKDIPNLELISPFEIGNDIIIGF